MSLKVIGLKAALKFIFSLLEKATLSRDQLQKEYDKLKVEETEKSTKLQEFM